MPSLKRLVSSSLEKKMESPFYLHSVSRFGKERKNTLSLSLYLSIFSCLSLSLSLSPLLKPPTLPPPLTLKLRNTKFRKGAGVRSNKNLSTDAFAYKNDLGALDHNTKTRRPRKKEREKNKPQTSPQSPFPYNPIFRVNNSRARLSRKEKRVLNK